MSRARAAWRIAAIANRCPTCGSAPGEDCRTSSDKVADIPHAARVRGDRCPRCAALLPADRDPYSLCARCELVRALEVERATKHVRRNP